MFSLFSASASNQGRSPQAGFSLLELVVSVGIIVLVLSIVITQQGAFNSAVLLRSQAYEVALTVREAQLSAVSAVNEGAAGTEEFRRVIGVHFTTAAPDQYVVFGDLNGNNFYDASAVPTEQLGPVRLFDPRFEIESIELNGNPESQMSVTFQRPNFDARFKTVSNTGVSPTVSGLIEIDVELAGGTGAGCPNDTRTIQITATGQVSVVECP